MSDDTWDGVDRRGQDRPSDLQYALQAIGARLKAIEEKFSLKVEHVCEDVEEIKTGEDKKHLDLEKRIYQRVLNEFNKISNKLDSISSHNASVNLSIQKLDARVDGLEQRLRIVEDAGKNKLYSVFQQVLAKLGWIILGVLGAGLLFALTNQAFWQSILKK